MGKTMNSSSNQTPRAKGRRSSLFGLGKVLGKAGKKIVSYRSHGVSSYLSSPVARKRRSYMAELTEYREVREGHWVKEGEADTSRGQGNRLTITMKLSFQCEPNLTLQLGGRLQGHPIGREVEGLSITWITSWQGERSFLSPLPNTSGGWHTFCSC